MAKKFTKKNRFKQLARVVLCLLLCVSMLGTTGVLGAMQAFGADEVTHRYDWENMGEYTEGTVIPYGHVVRYIDPTTGKVSQTPYLYKVITGFPWGLVGRGLSEPSAEDTGYCSLLVRLAFVDVESFWQIPPWWQRYYS